MQIKNENRNNDTLKDIVNILRDYYQEMEKSIQHAKGEVERLNKALDCGGSEMLKFKVNSKNFIPESMLKNYNIDLDVMMAAFRSSYYVVWKDELLNRIACLKAIVNNFTKYPETIVNARAVRCSMGKKYRHTVNKIISDVIIDIERCMYMVGYIKAKIDIS